MNGGLLAGRYQVEEEIGRGGMATVYRGFDRSLERRVAIKMLHAELAGDEEIVGRFRAEAQSAARLSHANIAQIFDTGAEDGRHFIVIEYLPEPDLKSIIRDFAPLPVHKVAEVALHACEALGYAHQHGIIHRDVKPHNILFTTDGRAKLADFGIAAAIGEAHDGKPLVGSAHYLSPEEVHGNAPTPQSDLYSLGVVMYEGLTGRTPFQGETTDAVIAKRLAGPPPAPRALNPNIPPAAEHVVLKAMATDPNQRYQSAGEMLADLRRLAAGAPVTASDVEPDATQTMVLPRHPEPVSSLPVRETSPGPRRPDAQPAVASSGGGWFWGVMGFMIGIVAIVGLVFLLKELFFPGPQTPPMATVPGVTGLSVPQASQMLADAELRLGDVDEGEDTEAPPGTVISQDPLMSARVEIGSEVDVTIAAPEAIEDVTVEVIDVVGVPLEVADANLKRIELLVGEIAYVNDDTAPEGEVMAQDPRPGLEVKTGQAVDLTVSEGPAEPTEVDDPGDPGEVDPGGEDDPVEQEPMVTIDEDTAYVGDDPMERRFDVSVIVGGVREGQRIKIVVVDEEELKLVVHDDFHDPGTNVEQQIRTTGAAWIEVLRDGEQIESVHLPAPAAPVEPTDEIIEPE
ncbi:MAG TPA: Stk1 family PASTA domain-containing Ser/Thr kinase [Armatimonadota bacterium]|nr:Stk1 family PASTA domain-containing Ser/Thr kinase [Armatimonadota bacterium]